jgi:spore coat polysaccharide biosynthesis protein SpsF
VRVIAAIQARMMSSRLPNKVMAMIEGKPMAWHVVNRLRYALLLDDVVLSFPDGTCNQSLLYLSQVENIPYYIGQEEDVIDRLYQTALTYNADVLVRITADCPLIDPQIVDTVVNIFRCGGLDYVSNVCPVRTYPAGIAVEAYSTELLKYLWDSITDTTYRDWFPVYLWERIDQFNIFNLVYGEDLSSLRWTVDYENDLEFVRNIYKELNYPNRMFLMRDILELLQRRPDIAAINSGIVTDPFHGIEED